MTPRSEYLEALLAGCSPTFAATSLALSAAVFLAALVVMNLKSPETRRRAASLPLDSTPSEAPRD